MRWGFKGDYPPLYKDDRTVVATKQRQLQSYTNNKQ
jgi:hypothetical protein